MKKIFLFSLLILFFSCSEEEIKSYKGKELKNFSVKKGEKFSINLEEDHKAGQTWGIKTWDDAVIEYQKSTYNNEKESADFIFIAKTAGETEVSINLVEYAHVTDSVRILVKVD